MSITKGLIAYEDINYGSGTFLRKGRTGFDITVSQVSDLIDGLKGPLVDARRYSNFNDAVTAAIGKTLFIAGTVTLPAGAITIPATVLGVFPLAPGIINKGLATSLTINAPIVGNPMHQWLSGFAAGELIFGKGSIEYLIPQWFGAKGNQSNNDTAAIQMVIDTLYVSDGGILYLPTGWYLVTTIAKILAAAKQITIRGAGIGSTIIGKYGAGVETLINISSAAITITHLLLEDFTLQAGNFIACTLTNQALFKVKNLEFIAATRGLDLQGAITGVIEKSHFYANQVGARLDDDVQGGSNFIKFRDCAFRGNTTLGIDFVEDANLIVETCNFETCGTALSSPPNLLAATWVNGPVWSYDTLTSSGGNITSAIEAGTQANASNDITNLIVGTSYTISYNLTLNSGEAPQLYIGSTAVGGFTNTFGALKTGANYITFTGIADQNYLIINSNGATNFSLTISLYASNTTGGIRVRSTIGTLSGMAMVTIRDCWFEANQGYDIFIEPFTGGEYVSILNNSGLGANYGIFVGKIGHLSMINNFWPNSPLQFDSSGVNIVGFLVNNVFTRIFGTSGHYIHMLGTDYDGGFFPTWTSSINTTVSLSIGGASTAITKHLSSTVTYNPPSINNGSQATTTITVTGAALGDTVVVSFTLDLQGIQLTGYVSATDTVTAILQNNTGGAIDLASGTLRADVWQH